MRCIPFVWTSCGDVSSSWLASESGGSDVGASPAPSASEEGAPSDVVHGVGADSGGDESGWGSDWSEDGEAERIAAGNEFIDYLLDLQASDKLSAKSVCVLCYFAGLGGKGNHVKELGLRPDAPSGHYQRHLDSKLQFKHHVEQQYNLPLSGLRRGDATRTTFEVAVVPCHESLAQEAECDPTLGEKLATAIREGTLPPKLRDPPCRTRHQRSSDPCRVVLGRSSLHADRQFRRGRPRQLVDEQTPRYRDRAKTHVLEMWVQGVVHFLDGVEIRAVERGGLGAREVSPTPPRWFALSRGRHRARNPCGVSIVSRCCLTVEG